MNKPRISIIAAISENRALGKDNKLIFRISEDLKRFKELTSGHPIIMGRKTFDSIGRALPNRTNIVITRTATPEVAVKGVVYTHSLEEAIEYAKTIEKEEIFIIGGGQIFEQAMPITDKLYLTVVKGNYDADVFFPSYSEFSHIIKNEQNKSPELCYTFLEIER